MGGDTNPDLSDKTLHYKISRGVEPRGKFIMIAGFAGVGFLGASQTVSLKHDSKNRFLYDRTTSITCANAAALLNPTHGCATYEVTFLASDTFATTWRQTT